MLRVGIVGMGGIGNLHADVYQANPGAELVCVCDKIRERADKAAERLGVRAYYSVKDMLANEDLNAAGICTSGADNGGDHYEPTMQCLEAGLHVLGEKPISNNIPHAREMVRTAEKMGVYYGINLNHRFTPPAAMAKEWCERGDLGELLFINMALWIRNPKDTPWFHLRALHPHSIDIMRYYCGRVKRVQAFLKRGPGRKCWSNASINMQFENSVIGHLTGSYDMTTRHPMERCEVAGSAGRFVLDNVFEKLTFYPHESQELRVICNSIFGGLTGFKDTFYSRINRWIEQVNAGVPRDQIEASGYDGLAAQEIIEAAIESHKTRSVVTVKNG